MIEYPSGVETRRRANGHDVLLEAVVVGFVLLLPWAARPEPGLPWLWATPTAGGHSPVMHDAVLRVLHAHEHGVGVAPPR